MGEVLYIKIVADIRDKIIKGIYKPGDMLKSETALMNEYQVGRMTIRRSIALLANQGYVYSVPGKGSFVCTPENDFLMMKFDKYDGYHVTINQIKLLTVEVSLPSDDIRNALGLKLKEKVVAVKRVFFSGKEKIAYEIIYFPYIKNEPVVEDVLKFSNYMVQLEKKLAFAMKKKVVFNVKALPNEVKGHLDINKDEKYYEIKETIIDTDKDRIVSHTVLYMNPEYYSISAESCDEKNTQQSF